MKSLHVAFLFFCSFLSFMSCEDEEPNTGDLSYITYSPELYTIQLPKHFPSMEFPADNISTKQGVLLGRHLFYDPILSADSTMSCSSCHLPEFNFTDGKSSSTGIDGISGKRGAMSLINIGFIKSGLFWDGRVKSLEEQALLPIEDPIELHHSWSKIIDDLKVHPKYPKMFREAFGIINVSEINKELAAKAIAQFERTIISKDSKFDKVSQGIGIFTDKELLGYAVFFDTDPDVPRSECGHCHNIPMATSDGFFNNGISSAPTLEDFVDLGRGNVTGSKADNGKFRAPTLRNIKYSAPYMHNGKFNTLDEVLDHYNSGGNLSPNKDPLIHKLKLDKYYLDGLKALLKHLMILLLQQS
ncbi:MAG: hypothetical protein IPO92_08480 [Saprospiraceae bacterium]|nr:hypothetical protein [Saprospiraceae bacterium]